MFNFEWTYNNEHGRKQGSFLPVDTCASLPQELYDIIRVKARQTKYIA